MNIFKSLTKVSLIAGVFLIASCESLDEINVNPNGVPTSEANANLLLPGIQRGIATSLLNLGYQEIGVSLGSLKRFETSGQISIQSLFLLIDVLGRLDDVDKILKPIENMKEIERLFSDKKRRI